METQFVTIVGIKHLPGCSALLFVRSFQAYFYSVEIVVIACELVARSRKSKVLGSRLFSRMRTENKCNGNFR